MILVLAEKPSAARNFAKALGGNSGNFAGEEYRITNARGHLLELAPPDEQVAPELKSRYKTWSLDALPWNPAEMAFEKKVKKDAKPEIARIKANASGCDEIAIATDDDPSGEGEMLAWEVLDEIGWKGRVSRMYFADESPKEVQKAFRTRKAIPSKDRDGDYAKAVARDRFDFLSMQWSRVATVLGMERGHNWIIRQGRLKSVMVSLVGDQQKEYESYVRKPYWEARYKDENGNVFKRDGEECRKQAKAEADAEAVTLGPGTVEILKKERKTTSPGKLLDLAALSASLASRGFKPKAVLAAYQKMYEDQIVSYPRTEDKNVTPEQFAELLPLTDEIARVVGIDPSILTRRTARPTYVKKGVAHGANRPGPTVPKSLADLAKYGREAPAIYETLAKNWLATLAEDCVYEKQTGRIKERPEFKGSANVILSPGYKAVFDASTKKTEEEGGESDSGRPLGTKASPFTYEGANPRPQRPSIKWLVGRLEKNNVGTGATRTSTISDVTTGEDRTRLMDEQKGFLKLTECGAASYVLLKGCAIANVEVTENLFAAMEAVGRFERDGRTVWESATGMVRSDMEIMKANAERLPKLASQLAERTSGTYAPTGEEVSFRIDWGGHRFTDAEITAMLAGETIAFQAKSSRGTDYEAKGKLTKQECKGKEFWGFEPEFKTRGVPDEWCGHVFTDEEKDLLEKGKAVVVRDAKSKFGKEFAASLKFKDGRLTPDFDAVRDVPDEWCGHVFTEREKADLKAKKAVVVTDAVSKRTGKTFTATLKWKKEKGNLKLVPEFG